MTNAPVIVHSTRRQVNNCHIVPRTGFHAHVQHIRPVLYNTPDGAKQLSHVNSRETNNSFLLTTVVTALSHFPTVGEGQTGDQYLYECRVSNTWQASIQSGKRLSDIPVMGTRL
jgi:hypothetical protein